MIQLSPLDAIANILQPLIFFIFGIAIYAIVVYNLYKFVATRDIFNLNLRQYNKFEHSFLYKLFAVILYFLEYILFFPLFLMVWFVAFSVILIALASNQSIQTILLVSMAIISSIRIVSYYSQSLARDIAKLFPLTLIAVSLVGDLTSFFSWERSWELIKEIPSLLDILIYYFVFVFVLEIFLRIVYGIASSASTRTKKV